MRTDSGPVTPKVVKTPQPKIIQRGKAPYRAITPEQPPVVPYQAPQTQRAVPAATLPVALTALGARLNGLYKLQQMYPMDEEIVAQRLAQAARPYVSQAEAVIGARLRNVGPGVDPAGGMRKIFEAAGGGTGGGAGAAAGAAAAGIPWWATVAGLGGAAIGATMGNLFNARYFPNLTYQTGVPGGGVNLLRGW